MVDCELKYDLILSLISSHLVPEWDKCLAYEMVDVRWDGRMRWDGKMRYKMVNETQIVRDEMVSFEREKKDHYLPSQSTIIILSTISHH